VYELARQATGADPAVWTVEIVEGQANARPDRAPDAALTVRFQLSDFMRIAAGTLDPAQPLLQGRASFEGDFSLAVKLPEMFGAPSPY
jgi:putative sterol carrier protein